MNDKVLESYGEQELDSYSHWVYVLKCNERWFLDSFDKWEDKVIARIGYSPNWLRMAWEANTNLYIGQTENLEKRLGQHFKNKNSSDYTTVYEPNQIRWLEPAHSRNSAEYREEQIGQSHYDKEDTFAYWN